MLVIHEHEPSGTPYNRPPPPILSTQVKPTHILNAAGITGRPNVDWCEDHKVCVTLFPDPTLKTLLNAHYKVSALCPPQSNGWQPMQPLLTTALLF